MPTVDSDELRGWLTALVNSHAFMLYCLFADEPKVGLEVLKEFRSNSKELPPLMPPEELTGFQQCMDELVYAFEAWMKTQSESS